MPLPCDVLMHLTTHGGNLIEKGTRKYDAWEKQMRSDIHPSLSDAVLQRVWSRAKADLAQQHPGFRKAMVGQNFADNLAGRIGRENAANFIETLDDLHPAIFDKLTANGAKGPLTPDEQTALTSIWYQHTRHGATTSRITPAGMAEITAALRAHSDAVREQLRIKNAPARALEAQKQKDARIAARQALLDARTPDKLIQDEVSQRLGKDGAASFMETLRTSHADIFDKFTTGKPLEEAERATLATVFEASRKPNSPTVAQTPSVAMQEIAKSLADARREARRLRNESLAPSRQQAREQKVQDARDQRATEKANRTPEEVLRDGIAGRIGKDGATKFLDTLKANHGDVFDKIMKGDPLEESERDTVATLYEANRKARGTGQAQSKTDALRAIMDSVGEVGREAAQQLRNAGAPARAEAGADRRLEDMTSFFPDKPRKADILPIAVREYVKASGNLTRFAAGMKKHFGDTVSEATLRKVFQQAAQDFKAQNKPVEDIKKQMIRAVRTEVDAGRKSTFLEKAVAVVKGWGMLSNPAQLVRNVASHEARYQMEQLSRYPAAIIDFVQTANGTRMIPARTLKDGTVVPAHIMERSVLAPDLTTEWRTFNPFGKVGKETMSHIWQIAKSGHVEDDPFEENALSFAGQHKEAKFGNPMVDAFLNAPFRAHALTDRPYRLRSYYASLDHLAGLQARAEKQAGKITNERERKQQLFENPTSEMQSQSIWAASAAVFQNTNKLSSSLSGFRNQQEGLSRFAVDLTTPFTKVPVNTAAYALESAAALPLGIEKALRAKITKEDLNPEQRRTINMLIGRGLVGAGLVAMGFALQQKRRLTGFDMNREDYAARRKGGNRGFSLYFNGKYYDLKGAEPVTELLGVGATMGEQYDRGNSDIGSAASGYLAAGAHIAEGIPPLGDARQLSLITEKPMVSLDTVGKTLVQEAQPTALRNVAALLDNNQRRKPESMMDQAKMGIPGLRSQVPLNPNDQRPPEEDVAWNPFKPMAASQEQVDTMAKNAPNATLRKQIEDGIIENGAKAAQARGTPWTPAETEKARKSIGARLGKVKPEELKELADRYAPKTSPPGSGSALLRLLQGKK